MLEEVEANRWKFCLDFDQGRHPPLLSTIFTALRPCALLVVNGDGSAVVGWEGHNPSGEDGGPLSSEAPERKLEGGRRKKQVLLDPKGPPPHLQLPTLNLQQEQGRREEEEEEGREENHQQQQQSLQYYVQTQHLEPPPRKRSFFPFPTAASPFPQVAAVATTTAPSSEYAHFADSMGDGLHHQLQDFDHRHQQQQQLQLLHHHPPRPTGAASRRKAITGGQIVEVQGGHIIRSTGRKDRHSKVCTAKGPRDRRVRLAAHTAIQFYDVQDRLGYDRPSKAVDWLMSNAKAAIDELAELPPWRPTATTAAITAAASDEPPPPDENTQESDSRKKSMSGNGDPSGSSAFVFSSGGAGGDGGRESSFLPASLESDAIADTIKFFFPLARGGSAASSSSPSIGFQSYPPDLLSRTNSQAQDLRLSLQSFQDPMLLHHSDTTTRHPTSPSEQAFFSVSSTPSGFESNAAAWSEQNARMLPWNPSEPSSGGGGGYMFNLPQVAVPQGVPMHQLLGHSPVFTQRGPLQSNNLPSIRGWNDPMAAAMQQAAAMPSSITGFASGGFSGFRIPARIQGEEEQDGIRKKPSSASRS